MGLFRSPAFSAASAAGLLINLGFYGELFVATLYFQQIRGYTALGTGLAMAPQMGMLAVASTLSGRVMARTGPRLPMIAGLALGGAGLLGLLVAGAGTPYVLLVAPLAAAGFGMAFTMPAATAAVMGAVPDERGGIASRRPRRRPPGRRGHRHRHPRRPRRGYHLLLPGSATAVVIGGSTSWLRLGWPTAVGRRRGRT